MPPSRFTKIKLTIGYTLLLAVLLTGLFFIRSEMRSLTTSGEQQELMTDSLLVLLGEKDQSVLQLIQLMNKANEQALTTTDIEKIVAEQDSVFVQQRVQRNVVERRDSVIKQPVKKKFFKRVAEVFVPSKTDSSVIHNTIYEVSVDTLLEAVNPADSLQQRIRKANEKKLQKQKIAARRNSAYFKKLNADLTARMDSLMKAFEQNITQQAEVIAQREQSVRQRASRILGGIALGAVLLSILFVIIIWRDLSRGNRYRRQLEDANKRAEDLLVSREKLMLAITHDIKAPLGSIIGYLELLNQLVTDEKQAAYLANMDSSSKHLLKLVTDLLDFHRLDLNKMEVNRESFNPYQLFQELSVSFAPLMQSKQLTFHTHIAPQLDTLYISDSLRIRQITTNLLSNALKFTNEGLVTLGVEYENSKLTIKVQDSGTGMEPQQKELIFQEFTRLPQAQGKEGFGLGLSIVRKLITLLEGTIRVESEVGVGTEFIVELPLYPVSQNVIEEPPAADKLQPTTEPLRNLSVLVIDDDKMQLALTHEMLQRHSIHSVCCNQVNELLDQLRQHHFDALLTDVQMPALNGFDLLRLLRSSNVGQSKEIPVIAVTARSEMSKKQFAEQGFAGCLHKPFTVHELLAMINGQTDHHVEKTILQAVVEKRDNTFDFSALTTFTEDDKEASKAVFITFIEETNKDIELLTSALAQNQVDVIAGRAHKLLPLFTMMKTTNLIELLLCLEQKKEEPMSEEIRQKTETVLSLLHRCLNEAQNYLNTL